MKSTFTHLLFRAVLASTLILASAPSVSLAGRSEGATSISTSSTGLEGGSEHRPPETLPPIVAHVRLSLTPAPADVSVKKGKVAIETPARVFGLRMNPPGSSTSHTLTEIRSNADGSFSVEADQFDQIVSDDGILFPFGEDSTGTVHSTGIDAVHSISTRY